MRKFLLITYYWPPAGGPGVQRVIKFLPHFQRFGYQPIVLTVENPVSSAYDNSLLDNIPSDIAVYKTKTLEPFGLYQRIRGNKGKAVPKDVMSSEKGGILQKTAVWLRSNFFIPDARIGWKNYLVKAAKEIIREHQIELIFSSSPPQSVQVGALKLKEKFQLPWVADFRDPWTDAYWLKSLKQSNFAQSKNLKLEKSVLQKADCITTVSEELIAIFETKANNNYQVVHNGFNVLFSGPKQKKHSKLEIVFLGNYTKSLDKNTLLGAIEKYKLNNIHIKFIGSIDKSFETELQEKKISFELIPYLPHQEMLTAAASADLLFLPLINGLNYSKGIISSKTFDYLSLQKPIVAVGPKGGIAERILSQTKTGILFDFGDADGLGNVLQKFSSNTATRPSFYQPDMEEIEKFSARHSVSKLCHIFDDTINQKA